MHTTCPHHQHSTINPTSINDLIDFITGRILDLLKIEHDLYRRWGRGFVSTSVTVSDMSIILARMRSINANRDAEPWVIREDKKYQIK